jgi:hypothetical protein
MLAYRARLQNKQAFLFRLVDVVNELFAMAATVSRAHSLAASGAAEGRGAVELADLFCRMGRRRVKRLFEDLWSNDDERKYRAAVGVLEGQYAWLEKGILGLAGRPVSASAPPPKPEEAPVGAR